jgi:choline-glycine betaine transporter
MQGSTPFHLLQLTELTALAPQVTDTAIPFTLVPIYYIHSLERPFCGDQRCKCHWQQQQVQRLLGNVIEGEMSLREAADFLDDINGEGK